MIQHFLLTTAARTLSLRRVFAMMRFLEHGEHLFWQVVNINSGSS